MLVLNDEDRTYCRISGIDEKVYLAQKIIDSLGELIRTGRIVSVEIDTQSMIGLDNHPTFEVTLRARYFPL